MNLLHDNNILKLYSGYLMFQTYTLAHCETMYCFTLYFINCLQKRCTLDNIMGQRPDQHQSPFRSFIPKTHSPNSNSFLFHSALQWNPSNKILCRGPLLSHIQTVCISQSLCCCLADYVNVSTITIRKVGIHKFYTNYSLSHT